MKVERGRKNMYRVQEDEAVQGKGFIKATAIRRFRKAQLGGNIRYLWNS